MIVFVIIFIVNLAISWFNAHFAGKTWIESKGTPARILNWAALVMSVCGFIWVYGVVLGFIAASLPGFNYVPDKGYPIWIEFTWEHFTHLQEATYLFILIPMLGSGLIIWIYSLVEAWKRRDLASGGVAAWNTYANVSNIMSAFRYAPGVFESFGDFIGSGSSSSSSGDEKGKLILFLMVIALALIAVIAGIATTHRIFRASLVRHASYIEDKVLPQLRVRS